MLLSHTVTRAKDSQHSSLMPVLGILPAALPIVPNVKTYSFVFQKW